MAEMFIVKTHKKNTGDVTFHSGGLESEQNFRITEGSFYIN